jgi:hypothetical protein
MKNLLDLILDFIQLQEFLLGALYAQREIEKGVSVECLASYVDGAKLAGEYSHFDRGMEDIMYGRLGLLQA